MSKKYILRTTEEIDAFFNQLEAQRKLISPELDLDIRMSLQKVKLQLYYDAKFKEYRKKFPYEKPMEITETKTTVSSVTKKLSKKEKRKKKIEEKIERELAFKRSQNAKAQIEDSVRFNNFRQIDAIVNYFKADNSDLNAVTERWIRHHIASSELLEYYKERMQKDVRSYRSVVFRMLNMSSVSDKDRRQVRIDNFKKKISSIFSIKQDVGAKKISLTDKRETSFDVLNKKEWILDWNCVMFKRGSVVIYSRSDLPVKFKPETVYVPKALESFNYLKKYLNERLPPVRCSVGGMRLKVIDKINFNSAILQFAAASRQGAIKTSGGGSRFGGGPMVMSFGQALSKAKQMSLEEFRKYKSNYIDFLVSQQSKQFKVIPCVERLAHTTGDSTEYAFMFTIECKSKDILIVYENVNPDRSTLLFIVKRENYDKSIRAIYDFLQSAEINKRSSIRSGDIDKGQVGIELYNSINHELLYSWQQVITNYKNHYHDGYVFYY